MLKGDAGSQAHWLESCKKNYTYTKQVPSELRYMYTVRVPNFGWVLCVHVIPDVGNLSLIFRRTFHKDLS